MEIGLDRVRKDLVPFADIGTAPPQISERDGAIEACLIRRGAVTTIRIERPGGSVEERWGDKKTSHASYAALLASDRYGNLRQLSVNQMTLLREKIPHPPMGVRGRLEGDDANKREGVADQLVNEVLRRKLGDCTATLALLIEGPAGIGKSTLIEGLVYRRAMRLLERQEPLVVHVASRGRLLTFINDVIAYTLQTFRWEITYDQLPVLARNGLVQVAIDGFDELGDPNGYEHAWGALRDLIEEIHGGAIILAGRETFIGRERLAKSLPVLEQQGGLIEVLQLEALTVSDAKRWLEAKQWREEAIEALDLSEEGSYALRPFFLASLAELRDREKGPDTSPPLPMLVDALIRREVGKLPRDVKNIYREQILYDYFMRLGQEIARFMRDEEAGSIQVTELEWICQIVVGEQIDSDTRFDDKTKKLLYQRVGSFPFLVADVESTRRQFAHTEFLNYFLALAAVRAMVQGETPKFVRRTIFGIDLLAAFVTILDYRLTEQEFTVFIEKLGEAIDDGSPIDRTLPNLWAIAFAALSRAQGEALPAFCELGLAEVVVRGKVNPVKIERSRIELLDMRDSDLGDVEWDHESRVGTAIANAATRVSTTFPEDVRYVELVTRDRKKTLSGQDLADWLRDHGRGPATKIGGEGELDEVDPRWELIKRICYKMSHQYWLREGSDDAASQLLKERLWPDVYQIMRDCNLVKEESRTASGPRSAFFHIKKADKILERDRSDVDVDCLFRTFERRR
jgi:hypothetical protein